MEDERTKCHRCIGEPMVTEFDRSHLRLQLVVVARRVLSQSEI